MPAAYGGSTTAADAHDTCCWAASTAAQLNATLPRGKESRKRASTKRHRLGPPVTDGSSVTCIGRPSRDVRTGAGHEIESTAGGVRPTTAGDGGPRMPSRVDDWTTT